MRLLISVAALLLASGASAATVAYDSSYGPLGAEIRGLVIEGIAYDVSFVMDSFDDLNAVNAFPLLQSDVGSTWAGNWANKAGNSIVDLFNADEFTPGYSVTNLYIAYGNVATSQVNAKRIFEGGYSSFEERPWENLGTAFLRNTSTDRLYASFSVASAPPPAIPVPAAVWLFGSALAGLGWMRRKTAV